MTAIERPLNDDERDLLSWLAIWTVVRQTGCTIEAAAEALDTLADNGEAILRGDAYEVTVEMAGNVLVRADRDWLALHATRTEELDLLRDGAFLD